MSKQRIVSIVLPDGYASADEFARDCGLEIPESQHLDLDRLWDALSYIREYEPGVVMFAEDKFGIDVRARKFSVSALDTQAMLDRVRDVKPESP